MKIEILGTGCPKCQELEQLARKAVNEKGINAEIVKIDKMEDIIEFGIMTTPAIVINGEIKAAGRIVTIDEIKAWI